MSGRRSTIRVGVAAGDRFRGRFEVDGAAEGLQSQAESEHRGQNGVQDGALAGVVDAQQPARDVAAGGRKTCLGRARERQHRFVWHDRKAWWQQEQAILAYLILYGSLGDPDYQKHAREAAAYYNAFFLDHGDVKAVATTLREVHSTSRHSWAAVAWINGKTYQSPTCELDVVDRVGGGDGYAGGFFYGLLTGESEQQSVNLGWAHGALLTTFPGDTTMATVEQVKAFAKGGSARIQR